MSIQYIDKVYDYQPIFLSFIKLKIGRIKIYRIQVAENQEFLYYLVFLERIA